MNHQPEEGRTIRAIIVDDTPDLRLLLRLTLERDGAIAVVAEAENGLVGIEAAGEHQPDLVMLDLAMPVMDGLEALPQIKQACPGTRVVVLSGFEADAMKERSLRAGADLYVQKGTSPAQILLQIRALLEMDEAASGPTTAPLPRPGAGAGGDSKPDAAPARATAGFQALAVQAAQEAPVGLIILTGALAGREAIGFINAAARATLGLSDGAGVGSLAELCPPLASVLIRRRNDLARGTTTRDRLIGHMQPLDVVLKPMGEDVLALLEEVRASDEAVRLRQAISTTAHEIRNPVTLLSGVAAMIKEGGDSLTDQQRAKLLAAVGRQSAILERVTDDLLTAAQAGRGGLRVEPRVVELLPMLADAARDHGIDPVVQVLGAHGVAVVADPARLGQMVNNLVSNAVKYGEPPYALAVSQEGRDTPMVRIAMLDSGPGVAETFRPRLFEEFTRDRATKAAGTGLGLYVVRSLAQAQGGQADYAPRPDGGSEFWVTLPQAVSATTPRPAPSGGHQSAQTGRPDSL